MAIDDANWQGRVLIVDADYDVLGSLSSAIRRRGHHVVLAADGRTGLARAVEIAAEVVLVDRDVPVLDVRTFLEVLRENPRTSATETFLMGTGDPSRLRTIDPRAESIVKPFNAEEVAARVDDKLRSRFGPQGEPELSGDLGQVALFDLLQVFAQNRRSGRLEIETANAAGRVWVEEGRVVDATYGGVSGEKALYRVVAIHQGTFVFHPGVAPERRCIDASTDQLLMEGARQVDETARLREGLPPFGAQLTVTVVPRAMSPLAERVVHCLDEPSTVTELLDRLPAPDLDILKALIELITEGALLVLDPEGERIRIARQDEAIALRTGARRLRREGLDGPVRLPVIAPSARAVSRFARALSRVEEFVAAPEPPTAAGEGALGSLGIVRLGGTDVELMVIPLDPSLRPLWGPVLDGVTTVLVLDDGIDEGVRRVLEALEVRPVQSSGDWSEPSGARDAIRAALEGVGRTSLVP